MFARSFVTTGLLLATVSVFCSPARAQEAAEPLRPQDVFLSDLAYPQERQEIQVSLAPGLPTFSDREGLQAPLVVEYGLTDAWQWEAAWSRPPLAAAAPHEFELGTQYSWLGLGGSGLHAALGVEAEWSGGALEAVVPYVVAAADAGPLHVFAQTFRNVLGDEADDEPEEAGEGAWGLQGGAVLPVNAVILSMEAAWTPTEHGASYVLAPGAFLPLPGGWEVGLGLPVALQAGDAEPGLALVLTYEFELGDDD